MKRRTVFLALLTLLLPSCGGRDVPSGKAYGNGPVSSRAGIVAGDSTEYRTKTGKTVIVTETHPVGQSVSTIEVRTEGFEHDRPETYEHRDPVSEVFVADLDGNGFDEIYIITRSQGSGSYGAVLAFASNRDKSLSTTHFSDIGEGDAVFEGYMGHDAFAVEGGNSSGPSPSTERGI